MFNLIKPSNITKILLFTTAFMFVSCVKISVVYFEVNPYGQVKSNKLNETLYIKFSSRVADQSSQQQQGFDFQVSQFHKSMLFASQQVYGDLFNEVKLYSPGDAGFILEYQLMESAWELKEEKEMFMGSQTTFSDVWCTIKYASSFYRNDMLLTQATGTAIIKQHKAKISKPELVFQEAVKTALAEMAQVYFNHLQ